MNPELEPPQELIDFVKTGRRLPEMPTSLRLVYLYFATYRLDDQNKLDVERMHKVFS